MPADILGKKVGPIGYGMLGLSWRSPKPNEEQPTKQNMWNGGEIYGTSEDNSHTLPAKYYEKCSEDASKVVLSIKGGSEANLISNGSQVFIRQSVETSLEMLGPRGGIDMDEFARVDLNVPIEEAVQALKELVEEGKVGRATLSEVSAECIRRAAKITKIVAVEVE